MRFSLVLSLLIAILAVVFALQNPQPMEAHLFFLGSVQGSTALILIVTFGAGVLVGLLSTLPARLRDRRRIRAMKKARPEAQASTPPTPPASSNPPPSSPAA